MTKNFSEEKTLILKKNQDATELIRDGKFRSKITETVNPEKSSKSKTDSRPEEQIEHIVILEGLL